MAEDNKWRQGGDGDDEEEEEVDETVSIKTMGFVPGARLNVNSDVQERQRCCAFRH